LPGRSQAILHDLKAMPQQVAIGEPERQLRARTQPGCFVCGQDNLRGLRIRFQRQDDGEVTANWIPASAWEGFREIIHGGIVSTVLDEAMSKAVAGTGAEALTAELRVRFRRHVTPGDSFRIRGWIVSRNKRMINAEAALTGSDGTEHAHAWATFLPLPHASEPIVILAPQ
jgi:acyl-coenzyme A thioesterase PaaI-like protein